MYPLFSSDREKISTACARQVPQAVKQSSCHQYGMHASSNLPSCRACAQKSGYIVITEVITLYMHLLCVTNNELCHECLFRQCFICDPSLTVASDGTTVRLSFHSSAQGANGFHIMPLCVQIK